MIRDWINPIMSSNLSTDPIPLTWVENMTETEWNMAILEKINSVIAVIESINNGNREYTDSEIEKVMLELETTREILTAKHNTDVAKIQKQLTENYSNVETDVETILKNVNKLHDNYSNEHTFLETLIFSLFNEYKKGVYDIIEYKSGDKIRVKNPITGLEENLNHSISNLYDMKSPWRLTIAELEKLNVETVESYSVKELEVDGRLNLFDKVYKMRSDEIKESEIEPSEFYELKTVVSTILETCENLKRTMSQLADNNTLLNEAVADLRKRG